MRRLLTTALLAFLGFAVAGCGATKKGGWEQYPVTLYKKASGPLAVTGTMTISSVKTGTFIRCHGGPGAKVPARGAGVSAGSAIQAVIGATTTAPPPVSRQIQITHLQDGSVTVSCTPSH